MHPDTIIAGLRRELERLDKHADDYADRRKQIEDEIKATDKLPRPVALPEAPDRTVDHDAGYLAGLYRELKRSEEDRADEIKAEIKRVETLLKKGAPKQEVDVREPTDAEIELRKQVRASGGVEQARNAPVPGDAPPPDNAPDKAPNQSAPANKEKKA